MEDINWADAVFGYIPEAFRDWYLKESGTYWDKGTKGWRVSNEIAGQVFIKKDLKKKFPINHYKANLFQDKMASARELIKGRLGVKSNSYIITNTSIFELIRDRVTTIKYQFEGAEYIEEIRL